MSLKDKVEAVNNAGAGVAPAGEATKAPKDVATGKSVKTEAFKQQGASIRAQMSEDQKAIEGSKSDKVAFVCALGDPNRKQARVVSKTSVPSYTVVGYKFKVLEDTTVPFAPIAEKYKTPLDVEPAQERAVKAGEIVSLNLVETAMFISRLEYAGKFSGEGTIVTLSAKSSKDRENPLPILTKRNGGSIKENMELIADMVGATADNKGTPQIKEEFKASFSALYKKRSLGKSTTSAKKAGEGQADIAAAFRNYYANK